MNCLDCLEMFKHTVLQLRCCGGSSLLNAVSSSCNRDKITFQKVSGSTAKKAKILPSVRKMIAGVFLGFSECGAHRLSRKRQNHQWRVYTALLVQLNIVVKTKHLKEKKSFSSQQCTCLYVFHCSCKIYELCIEWLPCTPDLTSLSLIIPVCESEGWLTG